MQHVCVCHVEVSNVRVHCWNELYLSMHRSFKVCVKWRDNVWWSIKSRIILIVKLSLSLSLVGSSHCVEAPNPLHPPT